MHAESIMRKLRILSFIVPAFAIASCDTGSGPESIPGTAATPLPTLPPGFCDAINFEIGCDLPPITNFASGVTEVIDNPDRSGINDSEKVARMQKFFNPVEFFGGSRLDLQAPLSFTGAGSFQAYTIKVWSSRPVGLLLKAEENTDGSGGIGRVKGHTGSGMWEELCYEFAGSTLDVIGVTIIFDNGVPGAAGADPDNWTFFYDDITLVENCPPGPPTELPVDFENDPFDYNFGPDAGFEGAFASVVTNPDQSGINTSSQVTRMVKAAAASGLTFGGATLELDTPADVEAGSSFTMKVWATRQVPVLLQPEPQGPGSGIEVIHTGTGWEELTFSLPALAGTVSGITVIFDINVLGDFDNNPADWTFYFDDITLVPPGSGGGGGGGGASSGTTPEFVLFGTTAPADAAIPAAPDGPQDFGSGATFDFAFADSSFDPVIAVTAGENYGTDVWVAFLAVTGYSAGFADGYDTFNAKVKGSPDNRIEVKLIGNGDDSVATVDVTTYAGSTDLGDGWYQLEIPYSEFTNVANIPGHTGWLLGPPGDQADAVFVFLMTDVGFSDSGGGGGGGTGALVNGDFETGDFTGWTPVFGPPGIGTAAPDNSGQGGRSGTVARLNAAGQGTTGNDVLIVQGPIGAGTIQAGDTITVSFDLYGSLAGPGGVVFVEVIFLDGAGNDNGRDFLDNDPTPYFPNGTWTTYSGDVTAGTRFDGSSADVSGGITLSLKAACGADVACAADASFDNVTLTIN